ncbi:hypothetical protein Fmac_021934 [Flemingia macrophylla]|uniref:Uncharacterized protein n=1 Tax=Flemingia macrophylla TaxID=520843 RepID=A0ABD1LY96_9FABA
MLLLYPLNVFMQVCTLTRHLLACRRSAKLVIHSSINNHEFLGQYFIFLR